MKRKVICAALGVLLLGGSRLTAEAEDYQGGDWKVEFTGKEMVSNFTSADLSEAVYALQPGDSVTISLELENKSGGSSEWYMTNRVLASLEDSSSEARGGAYTYRLTYTEGNGTMTTLYESEAIGGEGKSAAAGLGLHEAAESLDEYFLLDTLSAGEKGKVTLMVALDGETQGNAYQNTLADLRMNFAVDTLNTVADNGNDGGNDGNEGENGGNSGDSTGTGSGGSHSYTTGGVKTGDYSNLALWSALAFASGAVLLVMALLGMKKDRKEEAA